MACAQISRLSRQATGSIAACICLMMLAGGVRVAQAEERIAFNRQIRPILSDRCFHCHGPDEKQRAGGFRLDLRDGATGEAESGLFPIVPGQPDESELLRRVASDDEFEQMPPPHANKPALTEAEVSLLRRWIEQGAEYQPHWSFLPPARPEPPPVQQSGWARNPIDHFVLTRMEAEGLAPSEQADKRLLIRRVSLDLTGLPPTPKEVEDFVADESPDAYEKLVDRLLASPRYGERMAWPWLEAARYADTNGFQGDPERTMWPWRDWVIQALNDNMPFDQFTIEQLAGDQLPNPTNAQIIATGFNRNHMHNGEGGRIAEETRVENVFDRTETTATVWMGLTYGCCRCHTHKFDPITHTDYFALYDFFNQTSEDGGNRGGGAVPPTAVYVPEDGAGLLAEFEQRIAAVEQELLAHDESADVAQAGWEASLSQSGWQVLSPTSTSTESESTLVLLEDGSLRAEGPIPNKDVYTMIARTDRTGLDAIRLEALRDEVASPVNSTGRAENGNAVLSEFEAFVRPANDPSAQLQLLTIVRGKADHAQARHSIEQAFDGKNGDGGGWATEGYRRKDNNTALFFTDKPFGFEGGTEIKFVVRCESVHLAHILARIRLSVGTGAEQDRLQPEATAILAKSKSERTANEADLLRRAYRTQFYDGAAADGRTYSELAAEIARHEAEKQKLRESYKKTQVMIMDTLGKPRQTRILSQGLYNEPVGEPVSAGVPAVLPPLPEDAPRNRLTLARWLVAPEHPLTARVTVNRYWQLFFGTGLVTTPEDFGTQGKPPTHPDLLDWLAVEFIESGWDVKHMHRLIVTSATYRQSSAVDKPLLEKDPANKLLARQNRFRMPSWMLRDQALSVSGLAALKQGGPPVKPYQPEGIWAEATFDQIRYKQDSGEALYRRSLYVFWRRIVGPTMFFDVANRQICSVETLRTNTPLHALTTLNDVTYVEAARGLATQVMNEQPDDAPRMRAIFLRLTAREPDEREISIVSQRLEKLKSEFAADPDSAGKLLAIGEAPQDKALAVNELAAYTALCNALMNLDEALNRP